MKFSHFIKELFFLSWSTESLCFSEWRLKNKMRNKKKNTIETLKEVMVNGHHKNFEVVFKMTRYNYKGINIYQVYSLLKKDGKIIDIDESLSTYSERDAGNYFDMLVNTYLRYRYAKIVK